MSESQGPTNIPLQDVTYKVIGAAMRMHNETGPGHTEVAYHRAMSLALEESGVDFEDEKPVDVYFGDDWGDFCISTISWTAA